MNLKRTGLSFAVAAALSLGLASCGPKDATIKSEIEAKLSGSPGVIVDVKDGVATLSGNFINEATKANAETVAKAVKGVKAVVDNATVPPPPAPVAISPDDKLKSTVAIVLKKYPGVMASVKDGAVTLTGQVKKQDLIRIRQALDGLTPKKVLNQATIIK